MEDHKVIKILKYCIEKQSHEDLNCKQKEDLNKIFNKINSILWYQENLNSIVSNLKKNNK